MKHSNALQLAIQLILNAYPFVSEMKLPASKVSILMSLELPLVLSYFQIAHVTITALMVVTVAPIQYANAR